MWWEGGRLSVGRGAAPSERRLLVWPLAADMRIKYVGFSALWGDKADFRYDHIYLYICPFSIKVYVLLLLNLEDYSLLV